MAKNIFFIFLLFLYTKIICRNDICSQSFEINKKDACSKLVATSGNKCVLINNSCLSRPLYSSCFDYNCVTPFEDDVC